MDITLHMCVYNNVHVYIMIIWQFVLAIDCPPLSIETIRQDVIDTYHYHIHTYTTSAVQIDSACTLRQGGSWRPYLPLYCTQRHHKINLSSLAFPYVSSSFSNKNQLIKSHVYSNAIGSTKCWLPAIGYSASLCILVQCCYP